MLYQLEPVPITEAWFRVCLSFYRKIKREPKTAQLANGQLAALRQGGSRSRLHIAERRPKTSPPRKKSGPRYLLVLAPCRLTPVIRHYSPHLKRLVSGSTSPSPHFEGEGILKKPSPFNLLLINNINPYTLEVSSKPVPLSLPPKHT